MNDIQRISWGVPQFVGIPNSHQSRTKPTTPPPRKKSDGSKSPHFFWASRHMKKVIITSSTRNVQDDTTIRWNVRITSKWIVIKWQMGPHFQGEKTPLNKGNRKIPGNWYFFVTFSTWLSDPSKGCWYRDQVRSDLDIFIFTIHEMKSSFSSLLVTASVSFFPPYGWIL